MLEGVQPESEESNDDERDHKPRSRGWPDDDEEDEPAWKRVIRPSAAFARAAWSVSMSIIIESGRGEENEDSVGDGYGEPTKV